MPHYQLRASWQAAGSIFTKKVWKGRWRRMIRVLQCVNNMHRAGLETMLMNYYRHIDRNEIQFDFLTHRPERADYDDEIEQLGGRVYYAPRLYPQNYAAYFSFMKDLFREHPEYQIVHSHIDAMSFLPLLAAKRAGIPVRIAHSHSTSIDRDLKYPIKQAFRRLLPMAANQRMACGQMAGEFLFGKRLFEIIPNAVDAQQYRFDPIKRQTVRNKIGLSDQLVLGHVGRFCYPKNHEYLIDVFQAVLQMDSNACLLLIGSGENETMIRKKVDQLGLADKVLFLGNQADVGPFYQAMDVFVMPSRFEGVPLTGVEAQFAGLPCVFSDRVPQEVDFTGKCSFISLDLPVREWAAKIVRVGRTLRMQEHIEDGRFDICSASKHLAEQYCRLLNTSN